MARDGALRSPASKWRAHNVLIPRLVDLPPPLGVGRGRIQARRRIKEPLESARQYRDQDARGRVLGVVKCVYGSWRNHDRRSSWSLVDLLADEKRKRPLQDVEQLGPSFVEVSRRSHGVRLMHALEYGHEPARLVFLRLHRHLSASMRNWDGSPLPREEDVPA